MKMKKPLNPIQAELLKKHIKKLEEKDGVLTEAFTIDGDEGMILYGIVSSKKNCKRCGFYMINKYKRSLLNEFKKGF
ncbi:hypothetical protein [Peribacillus sp. ACCC06369]|uniref:hypothetical protein n=1 Tax=Peribacillus sp. ACCC06369 TaxID=3055860 RepID=UPI0025A0232F|nr:hypothetical protein [Peribacillus sp. ACCC06369]MDM5356789.1 hypothetical protein [Peribacillus sp. ACCC06369]